MALGIEIPIIFTTVANAALSSTHSLGKGLNSIASSIKDINDGMTNKKIILQSDIVAKIQKQRFEQLKAEAGLIGNLGVLSGNYFETIASKSVIDDLATINSSLKSIANVTGKGESARLLERLQENVEKLDSDKLKIVSNSMSSFNEVLEDMGDKNSDAAMNILEEMNEAILKGEPEKVEMLSEQLNNLTDSFKTMAKVKDFAKQMGQIAKSAIGLTSLVRVLGEVASAHEEVAKTAWEMGLAQETALGKTQLASWSAASEVRKTADAMGDSALRVGTATKTGFGDAAKAMSQIARLKITKNIDEMEELAVISTELGIALGIGSDSAAQFIKDLVVIGGVPVKMVRKAANALVTVQYNLGLTGEEATAVMSQVGKMMRQFQLFGASAKQVDMVVKEVAKLSAVFTRAGLDASEAHDMLNKLLDPTAIETNVMLWKGLGMSAAQGMALMQGDGSQLNNIAERQVELARKLKAQYGGNIFALKAMAEAHGMSLATVQGLAAVQKKLSKEEMKDIKIREAADAARQGMMSQLAILWNSISIILHKAIFPILTKIITLVGWAANIISKISGFFDGITKKGNEMGGIVKFIASTFSFIVFSLMALFIAGLIKASTIGKLMGFSFGKMKNAFLGGTGMIKGAAAFTKQLVSSLAAQKGIVASMKAGAVAAKAQSAAGALPGLGGKQLQLFDSKAGTKPSIDPKAGKLLKSFPSPVAILAIAVAIVALGAAIGIVVYSFSLLATAMKDFDLAQMLGFAAVAIAILVPLMIGLVFAIGAIGAIGTVAAPGMFAVAAAILAIGIGVGIIIASIALLAYTIGEMIVKISESGVGMGEMVAGLFGLAAALGAIIIAATFGAPALAALSIGVALLAASLFLSNKSIERFSTSMLMLGTGLALISDYALSASTNLGIFIETMKSADIQTNFLQQIQNISSALKDLEKESPIIKLLTKGDISQVEGKTATGLDTSNVVQEIQESNRILGNIENFTKETVTAIDGLTKVMKVRKPMTINVG